jgi:hypothetical protein
VVAAAPPPVDLTALAAAQNISHFSLKPRF